MTGRTEWHVYWRGPHWRETTYGQTKHFQREHAMRRFVAQLLDRNPTFIVEITVRDVGEWRAP